MPTLRRILIDCTLVDFSRQPTGIPRVVLKYIETGYVWGERNGVEVVPVVPADGCVFICRPVPGRGAPASLLTAASVEAEPEKPAQPTTAGGAGLIDVVTDLRHTPNGMPAALGKLGQTQTPAPVLLPVAAEPDDIEPAGPDPFPLTRSVRVVPGPHDMVFCPAYWHDTPPDRYRGYAALGAKVVILVHDILPITFPRFYDSPWCYEFRRNVVAAHSYAAAFCTVSDYTRHGLAELAFRERLKPVPAMTTYNGFEPMVTSGGIARAGKGHIPESGPISAVQALGRYYLMVGSIEPKKGHRPVIACFEAMWAAGLQSNLVIIGRRGWMEQDALAAIETSPFYGTKLFWFSGVDDFELGVIYESARALIFSSLGEGFGIPMIEAAAYGRPVIAYDTPIVQEILAGRARTFVTGADLVARIVEMEQDGPHAAASADASQVGWPTWEDYTPRVFDVLRDFFEAKTSLPDAVAKSVAVVGHIS